MSKTIANDDSYKLDSEKQILDPETGVRSNMIIQLVTTIGMLSLFLVFRRRAPWVYFPNSRHTPNHPCFDSQSGMFSWIKPVLAVKDTKLLNLIGLDSFMLLQTIKLLGRICLIFGVGIVPWMSYLFYNAEREVENKDLFIKLSIQGVRSYKIHMAIVGAVYVATVVIYYLIFIYYKRYITLRQLYMASPAAMTSIVKLKALSRGIGPESSAVEHINIMSRTALIQRLPEGVKNDADCLEYIRKLGVGEVESVSIVRDTARLHSLYEQRDICIQNIEKETDAILSEMGRVYAMQKELVRCSFGASYQEEGLFKAGDGREFTADEKISIANRFFARGDKFMDGIQKKSFVGLCLSNLQRINEEIKQEQMNQAEAYALPDQPGYYAVPVEDSLFIRTDPAHDVSFFSLHQLLHIKQNWRFFSLDFPIGKRSAFVTFKDPHTLSIVLQSQIGSRVFACIATPAPAPHDVIWKNIIKSELFCYFARLFSIIAFALMCLFFYYVINQIISVLRVDQNPQNLFVRLITYNKKLASIYVGCIVPLVYNVILYFVPITIAALLNLQGITSYSSFQIQMMNTFSMFLFFNGFLFVFAHNPIADALSDIQNNSISLIFESLSNSIIKTTVFFFNTVVQRLFVGTAIVLLKPGPFLFHFVLSPFIRKNRRQLSESEFAPPADMGNIIPNILLIFPIVISYACISPPIVVLGWLFYLFNYFVYKCDFLYASKNEFESGGIFWKHSAKFILYAVTIFHCITAIKLYSFGHNFLVLCLSPLPFISFLYHQGLVQMFERSCDCVPLGNPECEYLDDFAAHAAGERLEMLECWAEKTSEPDEDTLPITGLVKHEEVSDATLQSFYKDPTASTSISTIIFPKNFYGLVNYIIRNDADNIFKLK